MLKTKKREHAWQVHENIEPNFVKYSKEFSGQHCQISAMDSTYNQGRYASFEVRHKSWAMERFKTRMPDTGTHNQKDFSGRDIIRKA